MIITSDSEYLSHHGILGMKWGIRRYQNKDGSLTAAGRKKAVKMRSDYTKLTSKKLRRHPESVKNTNTSKEKSIKDMSNDEIRQKIDRIKLEKELSSLTPKHISRGKRMVDSVMNKMVIPAAEDVGKQFIKSKMTDVMNKSFNLEGDLKIYTNNKKK